VNVRQIFDNIPNLEVTSASPGWVSFKIPPDLDCKDRVVDFFRSQIADLENELACRLTIALDELLSNAIEHGCKEEPACGVEFSLIRTERILMLHIRDAGPGFSISAVPHAALSNPPEDPLRHAEYRSQTGLRPGGFGILLVKQIADELIYNEIGNAVVLIKYL